MSNQTPETLKRINAKQTLGLPLTDHEAAVLALYGTPPDVDDKSVCKCPPAGCNRDDLIKWETKLKSDFVRDYLSPLLREANIEVKKAEYTRTPSGEEIVIVTYNNNYTVKKCVSADSLIAIVRDVTREI